MGMGDVSPNQRYFISNLINYQNKKIIVSQARSQGWGELGEFAPPFQLKRKFQNYSPNTAVYFTSITLNVKSRSTLLDNYVVNCVTFQFAVILVHSYIVPLSGWGFKL